MLSKGEIVYQYGDLTEDRRYDYIFINSSSIKNYTKTTQRPYQWQGSRENKIKKIK